MLPTTTSIILLLKCSHIPNNASNISHTIANTRCRKNIIKIFNPNVSNQPVKIAPDSRWLTDHASKYLPSFQIFISSSITDARLMGADPTASPVTGECSTVELQPQ